MQVIVFGYIIVIMSRYELLIIVGNRKRLFRLNKRSVFVRDEIQRIISLIRGKIKDAEIELSPVPA